MFQKASGGKISIGRKFLETGKKLLKEVDLELQNSTKTVGKEPEKKNNELLDDWDTQLDSQFLQLKY
jgi:hypothetical protein